jgi:hypothetical protein
MVDVTPLEEAFGFKVYNPKVTTHNNILPPLEELQNCTTCLKGREYAKWMYGDMELNSMDDYLYHCRWDGKKHIGVGMRHRDNDCTDYIRIRKD